MIEYVMAIAVFTLAITGLSLGVIFGRKAPQSCAGASNTESCGGCQRTCERRNKKSENC